MNTLRISDILAHGVPVEWYEAIALVRAVADAVVAMPGPDRVPEPHGIVILPDGSVSIVGGAGPEDPVHRLGQMLQATLVHSDPPVQLRLLVSQAMAPVPAFGSTAEFQEALGYFERPNRSGVLQALYDRATQYVATQEDSPAPTLDMIAPLPDADERQPQPKRSTQPRQSNWLPVVAMILVAFVITAYGVGRATGYAARADVIAGRASDRFGTLVLKGFSALSEAAGLGRLTTNSPSGAPAAAAGPSSAPGAVDRGGSPSAMTAAATSGASSGTASRDARASRRGSRLHPKKEPTFQIYDDPVAAAAIAEAVVVPADTLDAASGSPAGLPREPDNVVYVISDDVTPPVLLRQQLPDKLPASVRKEDLARIEFVVLQNGTVDEVKLMNHRDVKDSMFLSAVKAWEFEPARKGQEAVKFRKVVWVAFH